jgi:poly(A)-specific ribonuclease
LLTFNFIVLAPGTPELDFYRASRTTISKWVNDPKPERSWVNIGGNKALNGFQRRLIYQLVRSEFPGYRTFGKNDGFFMQITKTDPEDEAKVRISAAFLQDFGCPLKCHIL